ncbi:MAG: squalene/phytoene synthase family protein [Ectothiorhodospiraceae bacterium]|nr:squalene/phytoene synthase family protein [Chromatiales bacterium]MCP5155716.1 squalene/phytoene synthase family protein [Ectothiorhodospiraceae bacterium]
MTTSVSSEQASSEDLAYQARALQGVSRTFALTIPQLPPGLRAVVANAYLLCRIADTIEDAPSLDVAQKRGFAERFIAVVGAGEPADAFAAALHPRLDAAMSPAERELVAECARVIRVTRGFTPRQQRALERCVRVMSRGMAEFQQAASLGGLADQGEMDRYCYHVAGVVGEMLTELFCDYSPDIEANGSGLRKLAVSFGQGLQMTNILKDMWEDRARGACWLPRDLFERVGLDLEHLAPGRDARLVEALDELVGIARGHLANALSYTLLIPRDERGIRCFCLWAIGMAVLTLRRIHRNPGFRSGREVKISRRSVRLTVAVTRLTVRHDAVLRTLFDALTRGLPGVEVRPRALTI